MGRESTNVIESPIPPANSILSIGNTNASNQEVFELDRVHPAVELISHVEPAHTLLPKNRIVVAITTLAGVNFLSSITNGLVAVGLPHMVQDINLPEYLIIWPSAAFYLTCGSLLLLAGSVADAMGNRVVNLIGCFLVGCFTIACGLAQTGTELIVFRAMQGIATSLCLPTSVAIVAYATPSGQQRNIGFAALGFVQPVGFSVGLVLEGVVLSTVGWRFGYYLCGSLMLALFVVAIWALPRDKQTERMTLRRLMTEIDWIGAILASSGLAIFSYVLATLTSGASKIRDPANIALSATSVAILPVLVLWESRQERRQKPALIPNSLWKNMVFTSMCLMIIASYAVSNVMEVFCSLYFQQVQGLSALQASIRIIPSLIVGMTVQLTTGFFIHRVPAFYLVVVTLILSAGGPLLMALINTSWSYWYDAFFAQLLAPLSIDMIFTVGLLVVTDVFPPRTQALAGAVFNTVAQLGASIGLSVMAVIASSVSNNSKSRNISPQDKLMLGYRASFWTAFAWMAAASVIAVCGLRGIGRIGLKRD